MRRRRIVRSTGPKCSSPVKYGAPSGRASWSASSPFAGIGSTSSTCCQTRLTLWTFQRNLRARRFYEANGFVAVRETDGAGNEEKEPDVLYRWELA